MASRAQKIRLAVFLLSAAGVLLLFLFYMAGRSVLTPRQTYFIDFPDSIGGTSARGQGQVPRDRSRTRREHIDFP